jgi:hypothetical protein
MAIKSIESLLEDLMNEAGTKRISIYILFLTDIIEKEENFGGNRTSNEL